MFCNRIHVSFVNSAPPDAKACPSGEFMCANRKCLATTYVCDGDDDCGDGSDELKCASPLTCGPDQLRCNTSECVPLMWSCDGDPDCSDSSDEGPERCGSDGAPYLLNRRANCSAGEFRCANGECVRLTWKCDGDPDCKDKSDESDCRKCFCITGNYLISKKKSFFRIFRLKFGPRKCQKDMSKGLFLF